MFTYGVFAVAATAVAIYLWHWSKSPDRRIWAGLFFLASCVFAGEAAGYSVNKQAGINMAEMMAAINLLLAIIAGNFVGTSTGTYECKGCAAVLDKSELAKHQLCPTCGNETRCISHLSKQGWERSVRLS